MNKSANIGLFPFQKLPVQNVKSVIDSYEEEVVV